MTVDAGRIGFSPDSRILASRINVTRGSRTYRCDRG